MLLRTQLAWLGLLWSVMTGRLVPLCPSHPVQGVWCALSGVNVNLGSAILTGSFLSARKLTWLDQSFQGPAMAGQPTQSLRRIWVVSSGECQFATWETASGCLGRFRLQSGYVGKTEFAGQPQLVTDVITHTQQWHVFMPITVFSIVAHIG